MGILDKIKSVLTPVPNQATRERTVLIARRKSEVPEVAIGQPVTADIAFATETARFSFENPKLAEWSFLAPGLRQAAEALATNPDVIQPAIVEMLNKLGRKAGSLLICFPVVGSARYLQVPKEVYKVMVSGQQPSVENVLNSLRALLSDLEAKLRETEERAKRGEISASYAKRKIRELERRIEGVRKVIAEIEKTGKLPETVSNTYICVRYHKPHGRKVVDVGVVRLSLDEYLKLYEQPEVAIVTVRPTAGKSVAELVNELRQRIQAALSALAPV